MIVEISNTLGLGNVVAKKPPYELGNVAIEGPFFGLGKEAKNEGLYKPRTSTTKEDFTARKIKTPTKGIFESILDVMPQGFFGTKLLLVTYV